MIPVILSDNQSALDIAENPKNYQRAKHIDIRYHFIRHALRNNQLSIDYIPSTHQPADVLTKANTPPVGIAHGSQKQRCLNLFFLQTTPGMLHNRLLVAYAVALG